MKIWDVEKNEIPSLSEYLKIGKGSIVQIAGSGGKTSLTYALADENPELKCAIITTTKRLAPENGIILEEDEVLDVSKFEGRVIETGVKSEDGKIGWVGDENYELIKEWADLVLIEADGSKRLPLKACEAGEPVWVEDATHTMVVSGMSAIGKQLGEVCHRYHLVEHIWPHYKTVTLNEIGWLLKKYYVNKYKELNPFVFLNQCDDDELLDKALTILKTNKFEGAAGRILQQ